MKLADLAGAKKLWRFQERLDGLYKKCSLCGEFKPLETDFTKCKTTIDKRTPNCNVCRFKKLDQTKAKVYYKNGGNISKAKYYQRNKKRIHKQRQSLLQKDPVRVVYNRIRKNIRKQRLLTKQRSDNKSIVVIGCSKIELFDHLKRTFESNYGIKYRDDYFDLLDIDHIIPISSEATLEGRLRLSHYTNLQFLYKKHNMQKKCSLSYVIPAFPSQYIKDDLT